MYQKIDHGIRTSLKTVLVLSPDFLNDIWNNVSDIKILAGPNYQLIERDLVAVMLQRCDVPGMLFDVAYVDALNSDWWPGMIGLLTAQFGKFPPPHPDPVEILLVV